MWGYFQAGGPMMWPLLVCSIAALAVILERCWFWHGKGGKKDEIAALQIIGNLESGKIQEKVEPSGILTAMLGAGLAVAPSESDKAMEVAALEEMARMRRGMSLLDTIITASPMLGIMGTVLGIISSFDMLGAAGVSDPKAAIPGIAQALITTATGLGIAVAAIFPYNYFNFRIDQVQDLMEAYASRLELAYSGAKKE